MKLQWSRKLAIPMAALLWSMFAVPAQTSQAGSEPAESSPSDTSVYHGGLISPVLPKPRFILTDTSGAPYDFLIKTQGYVTLLFFGYAHCTDVCPMQMHVIARAIKAVPPATADQLKVVFVSTDPDHDTPQVLQTFLAQFDERFIGLTGSQEAIDAAQRAANIPVARKTGAQAGGISEIGHAAFVLAYTKDNLAHVIYPDGMKEADWVHDLPYLTRETWAKM
jgi:protein SCO1/2